MTEHHEKTPVKISSVSFDEEEVQEWFEEEEEVDSTESKPATETIADKYAKSQLRVVRETKDYTLDYLQHALQQDRYIINVAPEYQRRQRWSSKRLATLRTDGLTGSATEIE